MSLIFILSFVFVALALYFTVEAFLFADSPLESLTWMVIFGAILLVYYIYLSEVG